jgi:hypothetical protein
MILELLLDHNPKKILEGYSFLFELIPHTFTYLQKIELNIFIYSKYII